MVFYPCDFEANADEAKFIHANVFVAYLERRFGQEDLMELIGVQGESLKRRWFRWRVETTDNLLNVFNVDEFLCKVFAGEVMLHDLPAHAFSFARSKPRQSWSPTPLEDRLRYGRMVVVEGKSASAVAQEVGFSVKSVRNWARLYSDKAAA